MYSSLLVLCAVCSLAAGHQGDVVRVDTAPQHKITTFRPWSSLGSTVDKEPAGSIPSLYSRRNIHEMLQAGWGWLSYRLYTELSDQDWHWNPSGAFSDAKALRGYWTSSSSLESPKIVDSFGYRLPHRGNTTDQGNNESYSRLDDGNPQTYWKSDPYLTHDFTGESDGLHPQWVVIDLEIPRPVNAIRLAWVNPYATQYRIEHWMGDDPINDPGTGWWVPFPHGAIDHGRGGQVSLSLGGTPAVVTRYVRVVMTASSNTCDSHDSADRRNCVGYAINELSVGAIDASGAFHDYIRHTPCGGESPGTYACGLRQTATYVSSVDPWHEISDRVRNQEQPGLDLIARSGLTRGMGAMYPVPMLYSTPQNAVAEVRYLRARGYPVSFIELGEEPDGQYTAPEDDAALYIQWARALHHFDPTLKLGGPVFSGVNSELLTWPDASGNISWLNRFLNYLKAHHAINELAFMSFEHYPLDSGCVHGRDLQLSLLQEPSIIKGVATAWRSDGLPPNVPMYVTEANYSSVNFTAVPMMIQGALWQADYMATALASGIRGAVYYQYEPVPLSRNPQCPTDWGNLTMFVADQQANIKARDAQFYAAQMLTRQWLVPGNAPHELYPAASNIMRDGYPLVTAYAAKRPDALWSVMLVNKDTKTHDVTVDFGDGEQQRSFAGTVTRITFGSAQYVWRARGAHSIASPDDPPAVSTVVGSPQATYEIPAQSITVLRGRIEPSIAGSNQ